MTSAPTSSDDTLRGLDEREAARRLAEDGPNLVPGATRRGLLRIVGEVLREPMFLLLIACGAIYLVLGDAQEAAMLLGFVVFIVGITAYQERRTERALDALRELSTPHALVIREGRRRRVPGAEVARGDLVVVVEGERVPADGIVRQLRHLSVDESLITGESVPVRKRAGEPGDAPFGPPGGEDRPWLFSGTLVVRGQAVAEVVSTGPRTEMGRIGAALGALQPGASRLQRETRRIVRVVAIGGALLCVGLVVFYGLTRGDWLTGLLTGLATAMAVLPEEFPVVLTVFLAIGAWRIGRNKVLTRRMSAIEALGTTTVLCTDKTGTLTENRMVVQALWTPEGDRVLGPEHVPDEEEAHRLVEYAILASQVDPFDPMERAFRDLGLTALDGTEHLHPDWSLLREYPLSPELMAMSRAWDGEGRRGWVVAAKGAPEAVFDLCHLGPERVAVLEARVHELAASGLRVLAVAQGALEAERLPDDQHDVDFELLGLIGLQDPLRARVPEAIARCHEAGVRVVMITGDYPETARSIAREAGLPLAAEVLTGEELARLDDEALAERLERVTVCARVVPEQKLRLVQALEARGEIVAMTGDGVNDAPALKAASIGIAMGERGTDVAREAASLVLLDDDFSHIVDAAALGRRIFANLRKAMAYIVAIHVPIAGLAALPVLFGWPIALLPVHIVFLELVIDPACSIVFEAEPGDPKLMQRPPRPAGVAMLDRHVLLLAVLQGLGLLVAGLLVYGGALGAGDATHARSLAFTTLMVGNVGLILSNRSWSRSALGALRSPNVTFWWVALGALALLAGVLYLPGVHTLLHFEALSAVDAGVAVGAGLGALAWAELVKVVLRLGGADPAPGRG